MGAAVEMQWGDAVKMQLGDAVELQCCVAVELQCYVAACCTEGVAGVALYSAGSKVRLTANLKSAVFIDIPSQSQPSLLLLVFASSNLIG